MYAYFYRVVYTYHLSKHAIGMLMHLTGLNRNKIYIREVLITNKSALNAFVENNCQSIFYGDIVNTCCIYLLTLKLL